MTNLNADFAAALGLPKGTRRAVLTLEVNKPPRIDVEVYLRDSQGRFELNRAADAIRSIEFSYRLVPFGER